MNIKKLDQLLNNASTVKIAVVGDFCLDKYLYIDETCNELSIETGLTAYQVIDKGLYPGGAGTVVNNLRALTANVICIGVIGDDGEGYELLRELDNIGANIEFMLKDKTRCTNTYTKPMLGNPKTKEFKELNRLDFKNFKPMRANIEKKIIENIHKIKNEVQAILVLDQFTEKDCGVINTNVRDAIIEIANENKKLIVYADSRAFIHLFHNFIVKCNNFEIVKSVVPKYTGVPDKETVLKYGKILYERNQKPVFVTMGAEGICVFDETGANIAKAHKIEGPIDICGAGDSASSGIVLGLALGASPLLAAELGNAVASITIQQIGVTGTATIEQVKKIFSNLI